MKFTLTKDIKKDSPMNTVLKGLLSFILLYILSDILVMNSNFGITQNDVTTTLFGNADEYIDPISEASFLEFWHTQIFFIMMILLTLNAIFIRVSQKSRVLLTNILMLSAISSLVFVALSFYISNVFIDLYIISYFAWHISAIYMIMYSFWRLNAKSV